MKAAALIHTRTFRCDFRSDFLVRPESFTSEDIQWARNYVLQATERIDELQGLRRLVADNGRYRLAGVVGFLEDIAKSCKSLTNDELEKSRTLAVDEKGRRVYAFIGMVIYGEDRRWAVSTEKLWKEYVRYVSPVWDRRYLEPIFAAFEDVDPANAAGPGDLPDGKQWGQRLLYESNPIGDQKLFAFYARSSDCNFSFCSNRKGVADIQKTTFTIVTASSNDITRLLNERSATGKGNFARSPADPSTKRPVQNETSTENRKKKRFIFSASCVMIFILILLMILILWANNAKAASLSSPSIWIQYSEKVQTELWEQMQKDTIFTSKLGGKSVERADKPNCFDEIRGASLPKTDLSIQMMFACEKHYMELLRKYKDEISFLDEKMRQLREEQTEFRLKIVPTVRRQLEQDEGIDAPTARTWLQHYVESMERSFAMSETLLEDLSVMKREEFTAAVRDRIGESADGRAKR